MTNFGDGLGMPEAKFPGKYKKFDSLQKALEDAWTAAHANGEGPSEFRVAALYIKGDNPIREYRIDLD